MPPATAETRVRLSFNRTLRARFAGEPACCPSSSPPSRSACGRRSRVALGARAVAPGGACGSPGRCAPQAHGAADRVKRQTQLGQAWRCVSRRTVALRGGRLRTTLRLRARRPLPAAARRCVATRATCPRAPLPRPFRVALSRLARLPAVGRAPAAGLAPVQALPAEQQPRRLQQDAQVEAQRPVLDVPEVELDPLVPRQRRPALTCAQPVMPGSTASRPSWRAVYWATCDRTVGRGPTRLMSPRSTLTRFGSSSSEKRRSSAPDARDARIALVDRQPGAHLLGAAHHRAQLQQVESRPPLPTRRCR